MFGGCGGVGEGVGVWGVGGVGRMGGCGVSMCQCVGKVCGVGGVGVAVGRKCGGCWRLVGLLLSRESLEIVPHSKRHYQNEHDLQSDWFVNYGAKCPLKLHFGSTMGDVGGCRR